MLLFLIPKVNKSSTKKIMFYYCLKTYTFVAE